MNELAPLPTGAASGVIYFGTPDIAVSPLHALVDAGVEVLLVVTRPDKRRGRGPEISASPVKRAAISLGLKVTHELSEVAGVVQESGSDTQLLGVVVAYGKLLPMTLLEQLPMVNVHYSLLPRWRGAAPVERAILSGDAVTGACIMRVVEALDTGDVHRRVQVAIGERETAFELRERISQAAIPLLIDVVKNGAGTATPQDGEPTYAAKIVSDDLLFDWRQSAEHLVRITRIGVGHTMFRGKRLNIRAAHATDVGAAGEQGSTDNAGGQFLCATNDGIVVAAGAGDAICITTVQPEGKPVIEAAAWARGARLEQNERFGS